MNCAELIGIISERPRNFAWLLGAGTSRSAGLPTAADVLWDLKRRYYCRSENQDISQQDIQSRAIRDKIQLFMTSKGFPEPWADNEYAAYFERIFADDRERQSAYLQKILSEERVSLSVGNRALGALVAMGEARAVFTTNFDSVLEKAVAEVSGRALAAFHIEGSYAANDALSNERYPIYCKLHGDFRFQSIKNLPADLKTQDQELGKCLVNAGNRFGLIVTGYSGRDASVMALLNSVLQSPNPFPHGLFWTGLKHSEIPAPVTQLFEAATKRGVRTEHVVVETFDALLLRLWRNIPNKPHDIDAKVRKSAHTTVNIPVPAPGNSGAIIRINALPFTPPGKCLALKIKQMPDWEALQTAERTSSEGLIFMRAESVWMWGQRTDAEKAFGSQLLSVEPLDISKYVGSPHDYLFAKTFTEKALARALGRGKPLLSRTSHHRTFLIADRHSENQTALQSVASIVGKLHGVVKDVFAPGTSERPAREQVCFAEAVQISVEEKNGSMWLVLDPNIWIWPKTARPLAIDFLDERRKNRLNEKSDQLLSAWCQVLLGTTDHNTTVSLSPFTSGDANENPVFTIGTRTAYSKVLR
jgi:hypothetical protein